MADKVPVKAIITGGAAVGLAEFAAGDTTPISHGGTGSTTAADARAALGWGDGQLGAHRNKIIGHFAENQRALTSVADDAYCLDRWYVLTESGNVTVAQITDPESGAPYAIRLTQPDATAKRMGLATIIEAKNIKAYRNVAMNFAARVKPSFAGNVRYAILEHTGTADVVTSDVVNNWASATFTPSNFFIAGVAVLKTGAVAPGAATYGDLSDWSALGASTNNVILFVWTEASQAQNATLELNRPQYEPGVVRTPQEWRLDELVLCQRYYQLNIASMGYSTTTTNVSVSVAGAVTMRSAPAFVLVNGTGALVDYGVAVRNISAIGTVTGSSTNGMQLDVTSATTSSLKAHALIGGVIGMSAEL